MKADFGFHSNQPNQTMSLQFISPVRVVILTWLVLASAADVARAAIVPSGFIDQTLATGLTNASTLAIAPDGRVFVGLQGGLIRVVKNGFLLAAPFAALPANSTFERGLLAMAVDPDFSSNNFLYVNYSATNPAVAGTFIQRVSRLTATGDVMIAGSETVLLETDSFTVDREVGGGLAFGSDGTLFAGMGQSGPSANAQVTNSLFGKILRLNKDGSIPADNPFFNQNTGKNRAIWALGFRNPFVIATQPGVGRIFVNDVGSGGSVAREEINDGVAGFNYGWPTCEGACGVANPALRNPFFAYARVGAAGNVITGGVFYNPPVTPFPTQYVGKYFFGDYIAGWIRLLDPFTTNVTEFATNFPSLVSLQVGPDGALYYLTRGGAPGSGSGSVGRIAHELAVTLVPLRSTWRYLDTGANLSNAWRALTFNDSGWSNGPAQLGYGDGDEGTVVSFGTNASARYTNTYFRRAFVVPDASVFTNLIVRVLRDDGCVVYLNSNEIFRSNLPGGVISSTTFASVAAPDDGTIYFPTNVPPALLVSGTNYLAVEMHQSGATSSDLSFDLDLVGFVPAPRISATAAPGTVELAWPFWATNYQLQTAAVVPPAAWSNAAAAVTLTNGQLRTTLGTSSNAQFFRLADPNL